MKRQFSAAVSAALVINASLTILSPLTQADDQDPQVLCKAMARGEAGADREFSLSKNDVASLFGLISKAVSMDPRSRELQISLANNGTPAAKLNKPYKLDDIEAAQANLALRKTLGLSEDAIFSSEPFFLNKVHSVLSQRGIARVFSGRIADSFSLMSAAEEVPPADLIANPSHARLEIMGKMQAFQIRLGNDRYSLTQRSACDFGRNDAKSKKPIDRACANKQKVWAIQDGGKALVVNRYGPDSSGSQREWIDMGPAIVDEKNAESLAIAFGFKPIKKTGMTYFLTPSAGQEDAREIRIEPINSKIEPRLSLLAYVGAKPAGLQNSDVANASERCLGSPGSRCGSQEMALLGALSGNGYYRGKDVSPDRVRFSCNWQELAASDPSDPGTRAGKAPLRAQKK